jgi:phosphoglycolate phosphatase
MKYKLCVFDWDGTLMDSEAKIVASLRCTISDLALPYREDEDLRNIIGLGLKEAINTLYPHSDERLFTSFVDRYRHHFLSADRTPSELFPGAKDTIQALYEQGYMLAVATGKGRRGLNQVLDETGLKAFFFSSRCAEETCSKPHPLMLLEIMEELDVTPESTLMIGDTEYDLEMANRAGVTPVGVSYGVHHPQRLWQHKPVTLLDSLDQLSTWLTQEV